MTIHEISLLDLPRLMTLGDREDLDGIHKFIHAKNQNFSDLLSTTLPFTTHIGARIQQDGQEFTAGMRLDEDRRIARLSFISPASMVTSTLAQTLFEFLQSKAGEKQMISVSAETSSPEIALGLKNAGFSTYYTQKIYQVNDMVEKTDGVGWHSIRSAERSELDHLYAQVTPPMIQFLEGFPPKNARLYCSDDFHTYCVVRSGTSGMLLMPYFQPDEVDEANKLKNLISSLRINVDQKMFILTRSTMGWVDTIVESLEVELLEEQKGTFKRLVKPVPQSEPAKAASARDARMLPTSIKERSALVTDPNSEKNWIK